MQTPTPTTPLTLTAFAGGRRLATGTIDEIARALAGFDAGYEPILVFDDATGAQVDAPQPAGTRALSAPHARSTTITRSAAGTPAASKRDSAPPPAVGRPRLGVVAREITLLPRHWEWLAEQPGGASAALRRLVDEARRTRSGSHARRLAKERTYRFMSAIAGHLPGFEEAARALFGQGSDAATAFTERIAAWPPDVRAYLVESSRGAFDTDPE